MHPLLRVLLIVVLGSIVRTALLNETHSTVFWAVGLAGYGGLAWLLRSLPRPKDF